MLFWDARFVNGLNCRILLESLVPTVQGGIGKNVSPINYRDK